MKSLGRCCVLALLLPLSGCGSSESSPVYATGGAAGTAAGDAGTGAATAVGGAQTGGGQTGGGAGGATAAGGAQSGGGAGGTTAAGGAQASGGTGGGGGAITCSGTHPIVNGMSRTCNAGDTYCPAPVDSCFSDATASYCCSVAQDPVATINHPSSGTRFVSAGAFLFSGTGTDPQDGTLTGGSLVWTSSISGQIGTGTSFNYLPSVGTHIITLTATDSNANTGTDSITLDMQP
jgi:hypothetical protein